jgi:hypothetical protein
MNLKYYTYETKKVRILWHGIYQREMGVFYSAEAANVYINKHSLECEIDAYSIQTPDGTFPAEWWPEKVTQNY